MNIKQKVESRMQIDGMYVCFKYVFYVESSVVVTSGSASEFYHQCWLFKAVLVEDYQLKTEAYGSLFQVWKIMSCSVVLLTKVFCKKKQKNICPRHFNRYRKFIA